MMRLRDGSWRLTGRLIGCALPLVGLSGCIQVRAPEKPIAINLNVKIQAEMIVRLQEDAKQLINNNPGLFPE